MNRPPFAPPMGEVLGTRLSENGKVVFEVQLPYQDALQLGGQISRVYLFAEAQMQLRSRLIRRGKNEATTYLLVPKDLRELLLSGELTKPAKAQVVENGDKYFLIFMVDKHPPFLAEQKRMRAKRTKRGRT